jgi:peroxiredoxin
MEKRTHLQFNDPAPEVELQTAAGQLVQLSTLWKDHPIVLAFTRHFGCPQCKEMLDQLVTRRADIEAQGLTIVVITQAAPDQARKYLEQRAPGLTGLADPERKAYAAFGLGHGSLSQTVFSPKIWQSNNDLAKRKGFHAELPPAGQDAMLMSGVFVIGTDGRIRLPYYYDHIADHPSVDLLLQGVLSTNWDAPFDGPIGPASFTNR